MHGQVLLNGDIGHIVRRYLSLVKIYSVVLSALVAVARLCSYLYISTFSTFHEFL